MGSIKNVKNLRLLFIISVALVVLSKTVFAYIDPGTGGIILNTIWPLIITVFVTIGAFFTKYFWRPIKSFFSKIFGKSS